MVIYDYSQISRCLICGSIEENFPKFVNKVLTLLKDKSKYVVKKHPKEIEREERDCENNRSRASLLTLTKSMLECAILNDSVLIVNGANYFGDMDAEYYINKFKVLNDVLADNNAHILFLRGNDNPKYFTDELINLSHIKTIKDYSIVKFAKFNCLCIGGEVSIDRSWKIEQEKRVNKKLYWENEGMVSNDDSLKEAVEKYNIACVVSTSCPSFSNPGTNYFNTLSWVSKDKRLLKDLKDERYIMDKVYQSIIENGKKPYIWTYSRFNSFENYSIINNIFFKSLLSFEIFDLNAEVRNRFGVNLNKKYKENDSFNDGPTESLKMKFHNTFRTEFEQADMNLDADEEVEAEMPQMAQIQEDNIGDAVNEPRNEPRMGVRFNYDYRIDEHPHPIEERVNEGRERWMLDELPPYDWREAGVRMDVPRDPRDEGERNEGEGLGLRAVPYNEIINTTQDDQPIQWLEPNVLTTDIVDTATITLTNG